MAIEDNRVITTNMEEIFLLQSMDGGGSGGGGGGFDGKYLVIEAAPDQQYGEPSISVGAGSVATHANGFVSGLESISGNTNTFTFGNTNVNTAAGTMIVGNSNASLASSNKENGLQANLIVGSSNELSELIYDNNGAEIQINGYRAGYLHDGYFYKKLDYIEANKIPYDVYGCIFVDLFTINSANNYEGKYIYLSDGLKSFSQLVGLGYKISTGYNKGNIIVGELNKIQSGSGTNSAWSNGLFGASNQIKSYRQDGECAKQEYLFGNVNKITTVGSQPWFSFLLGDQNEITLNLNPNVTNHNDYNFFFGKENKLINQGTLNSFASTDHYSIMMGKNNEIAIKDGEISTSSLPTYDSVLIGKGNKIRLAEATTKNNFLFGENNKIDTSESSTTDSQYNYLFGYNNTIELDYDSDSSACAQYNYVFGDTINLNKSKTTKYNLFIGENHALDYHIDGVKYNIIGGNNVHLVGKTSSSLIINNGNYPNYTYAALDDGGAIIGKGNKVFGSQSFVFGSNLQNGIDITTVQPYNENNTYSQGDFCFHETDNNNLMKCKENGVTGAWDSNKWDLVEPTSTNSKGLYNLIQGSGSTVLGNYNTVFGEENNCTSSNSLTNGYKITNGGSYSYAGGRQTTVNNNGIATFAHGMEACYGNGWSITYEYTFPEADEIIGNKCIFNKAKTLTQIKIKLISVSPSEILNYFNEVYFPQTFNISGPFRDLSTDNIVGGFDSNGTTTPPIFSGIGEEVTLTLQTPISVPSSNVYTSNTISGNGSAATELKEGVDIELFKTKASNRGTVAFGGGTVSNSSFQTTIGFANEIVDNKLFVIGNGKAQTEATTQTIKGITRSNALTVDWEGNQVLAGKLTVGTQPTANNDVTTKTYVDNKVLNVENIIASAYDSTSTYDIGDYVIYNHNLYICNTNISVAEIWDNTHWTQIQITDRIETIESDLNTPSTGIKAKVNTLETTVGDATGGLVKDINDIQTTLGDGTSSGLVYDVAELQTTVAQIPNNYQLVRYSELETGDGSTVKFDIFEAIVGGTDIEFDSTTDLLDVYIAGLHKSAAHYTVSQSDLGQGHDYMITFNTAPGSGDEIELYWQKISGNTIVPSQGVGF